MGDRAVTLVQVKISKMSDTFSWQKSFNTRMEKEDKSQ